MAVCPLVLHRSVLPEYLDGKPAVCEITDHHWLSPFQFSFDLKSGFAHIMGAKYMLECVQIMNLADDVEVTLWEVDIDGKNKIDG